MYQMAIYNDAANSYLKLNDSMSCQQKMDSKYTREMQEVRGLEDTIFHTTTKVEEEFTRRWFIFFTHCSDSDASESNDGVVYPIIEYNVTMTLSDYVTTNQATCNVEKGTSPLGTIIGVICIVIIVLVIGGVAMWRYDVYQRGNSKEKRESLIAVDDVSDDEEKEIVGDSENDSKSDHNDKDQQQLKENVDGQESPNVELQSA